MPETAGPSWHTLDFTTKMHGILAWMALAEVKQIYVGYDAPGHNMPGTIDDIMYFKTIWHDRPEVVRLTLAGVTSNLREFVKELVGETLNIADLYYDMPIWTADRGSYGIVIFKNGGVKLNHWQRDASDESHHDIQII